MKIQTEGNLHQWFKGSKSKDGKGGWVNVVTGGTCASDEPGEGTPKCVSSSKRASMTKAERFLLQEERRRQILINSLRQVLQNLHTLVLINLRKKYLVSHDAETRKQNQISEGQLKNHCTILQMVSLKLQRELELQENCWASLEI